MSKAQQNDARVIPQTKAPADWLQEVTPEQRRYRDRLTNHLTPRLPTGQERREVVDYIMAKHKIAKQERWMEETYYDEYTAMPLVVFDHYETHGFAYEGKLLLAVSDYDPALTEAYIWRNGKVETIDRLHRQIEHKAKAWQKRLAGKKTQQAA